MTTARENPAVLAYWNQKFPPYNCAALAQKAPRTPIWGTHITALEFSSEGFGDVFYLCLVGQFPEEPSAQYKDDCVGVVCDAFPPIIWRYVPRDDPAQQRTRESLTTLGMTGRRSRRCACRPLR